MKMERSQIPHRIRKIHPHLAKQIHLDFVVACLTDFGGNLKEAISAMACPRTARRNPVKRARGLAPEQELEEAGIGGRSRRTRHRYMIFQSSRLQSRSLPT